MVIDDSAENIHALVSLLKADYRVSAARNGETGLQMASRNHPDLIILDIRMPGLDGYEVCRRLKSDETTRRIPIIFITAASGDMDEVKAFQTGAIDYITKPFSPVAVKARVKTHVELKKASDLLETLSSIDGLTNIYNRRKFDELMAFEWRKAQRRAEPLSVLFLDIDHFKNYNDHYGHPRGDECLKRIAATLKQTLKRPEDILARYGGEEFVMILPNTDQAGVEYLGESIMKSVRDLNIPHEYSSVAENVTVSIGGATAIPEPGAHSHAEFLEIADKMLYSAKAIGRNQIRCVFWDSLQLQPGR